MTALASLLLACSGPATDADDRATTGPVPTADTAASASAVTASCDLQANNALRVVCEVDLVRAGPATLTLQPEDGSEPARTFVSAHDAATDHALVGWDLVGDTTYTWTVTSGEAPGVSGTVTTGTAPPGPAIPLTVVLDGPSSIDRLLLPYSCGGDANLVVVDAKGTIRWYDGGFAPFLVNGINASDRGSFLAVTGRARVTEIGLDGTVLLDLDGAEGAFEDPIHHDVAARFGHTVVLNSRSETLEDGVTYVMDGVYELDPSGVVGEWNVGEVLDPQGLGEPAGQYWMSRFGTAVDFGHANAIEVDERGVWLVSFKHLDTVMAIRDGQLLWSIAGGSRAPAPGTLALTSTAGIDASFEYQHNVHWTDEGTLMLVDNGRDSDDWTRILELAIDEQGGIADVIGEFVMTGARCPIQSSGYRLPDGTVVAACTGNRHLYEFDPDGTLRREVVVGCGAGVLQASLVRAIPVAL